MDPIIAGLILQGGKLVVDLWRAHANKPPEWNPGPDDWKALESIAAKTAAEYKDVAGWKARPADAALRP